MPEVYNKAFIPLESNPQVFNELITALGASPALHFQDILTLDDPAFLPSKILALILVFPTTPTYEARLTAEDAGAKDWMVEHDEEDEDAVWFKQTINNASPMDPAQAAMVLEGSQELEDAYAAIATKGDTTAPQSAEEEVYFHYICFVKSPDTGHLYELDGDRKGPVDRGIPNEEEKVDLGPKSVDIVRNFIQQGRESIGFSLLALTEGA
ncbi:ubiquitinyl hydrolase 1 [Colletotrichum sp. CLE4]